MQGGSRCFCLRKGLVCDRSRAPGFQLYERKVLVPIVQEAAQEPDRLSHAEMTLRGVSYAPRQPWALLGQEIDLSSIVGTFQGHGREVPSPERA